jgi:hypothetical protein
MKLPRRRFLHLAAGAAALPAVDPRPSAAGGGFLLEGRLSPRETKS